MPAAPLTPLPGGIERKLAVHVTLGMLLFLLVAAAATYGYAYWQQVSQSKLLIDQLAATVQAQAEVGVFARNEAIIDEVLNGLLKSPVIRAVRIESNEGFAMQRSTRSVAGTQEPQRYPLRSPVDGRSEIGRLEVSRDEDVVAEQAMRRALYHAVLMVLQMAIAGWLMMSFYRRNLGQPVFALVRSMARLKPGSGRRLASEMVRRADEIGLLASGVNDLLDAAETAIDTERRLRLRVEKMERQYRRIFESSHVGIMVLGPRGQLLFNNPVLFERIVPPGEHGPPDENFPDWAFASAKKVWAMVREAEETGQAVARDLLINPRLREQAWVHAVLSVVLDRNDRRELIEGVVYDVTARRLLVAETRRIAERDPLTGLHNRLGFETSLEVALRHDAENRSALALMLIDLDGFKAVNDRFGHAAGDQLLVALAERMRGRVQRASDLVARLGGDEFVVMLAHCDPSQVGALTDIAEDLVRLLAMPVTLAGGDQTQVGASIGIACFPAHGTTGEALLQAADAAMYQVKQSGKNGYRFSGSADSG